MIHVLYPFIYGRSVWNVHLTDEDFFENISWRWILFNFLICIWNVRWSYSSNTFAKDSWIYMILVLITINIIKESFYHNNFPFFLIVSKRPFTLNLQVGSWFIKNSNRFWTVWARRIFKELQDSAIKYEFSVPLEQDLPYIYKPGEWSTCSVTCGKGLFFINFRTIIPFHILKNSLYNLD